ncbi:uncharacterized protein C8R40DRAFT_1070815 [Lentinula edodes]|uniref:uncharacterized protein n=1 Tax=Lentinula edodes TaxID=5353 RepID=UPI001E8E7136|nr:uncharacterized protein C8R40DRAFT_1070815 [Lentinula edodes]KAH7873598.1 hypothetical protein C8R40DRAFT_1070815 [Lentinula edodes]KAJ3911534.1 hypothetical protein F5877DRAFT_73103 [Lentinula edodes]
MTYMDLGFNFCVLCSFPLFSLLLILISSLSIGVRSAPYGAKDIGISVNPCSSSSGSEIPPVDSIYQRGLPSDQLPPHRRGVGRTFQELVNDGILVHFMTHGEADNNVFDKTLEGITFGQKIKRGLNNDGIWEISVTSEGPQPHWLQGRPKHKLLAKFSKQEGPPGLPFGEVKALRMMGLLVAAGKIPYPHSDGTPLLRPAIIMEKKEGVALRDTNLFKFAPFEEQGPMMNHVLELMCRQVAQDAVDHKVYHLDNALTNGLIPVNQVPGKPKDFSESVKAVEIVDYGNAYMVMKETSYDELKVYLGGRVVEEEFFFNARVCLDHELALFELELHFAITTSGVNRR